ncbi:endonuclease/exonuclease/phosphatase family protein [Aureibacter tunicatorum]|uniref:Exonuclease III n=1 Tax=Aureibacter tunicatorum TaxID=866807 RepID=A0AAE4BQF0_9BACT|nr:hypothetical protein [Aureibacter tunicatorum]MDR6237476.1 exonuclease III [Aureibacter tunicatorum]BDD06465.1 endonuclease [Aureibacter tunicatorum]
MARMIILLTIVKLFSIHCAIGQEDSYRIMFYNVENMFDTLSIHSGDKTFSPDGIRKWNSYKYVTKRGNIYKVIANSSQEFSPPDIIGLAEIENKEVLTDLFCKTPLIKAEYEIIHFESKDFRGIDVALVYRKKSFTPLFTWPLRIDFEEPSKTSRDILYVKGILGRKDTLHLFVNHWPSRYGGEANTVKYRKKAAQRLKKACDSIGYCQNIIIMGDLNDNPENESIEKTLKASLGFKQPNDSELVNLMAVPYKKEEWTHAGNGDYYFEKSILDHFIVNKEMLDSANALQVFKDRAYIIKEPWMLTKDRKRAKRTFYGFKYEKGYSDHLPIYIDLYIKK